MILQMIFGENRTFDQKFLSKVKNSIRERRSEWFGGDIDAEVEFFLLKLRKIESEEERERKTEK